MRILKRGFHDSDKFTYTFWVFLNKWLRINSYSMIEAIKGIFDKSSPLFMISIAFFVIAIIALGFPSSEKCSYNYQMRQFEIVLAIATGTAIVFKTIVLEIITKFSSSAISTIHILIIIAHLIADIALYIWSLKLYLSVQK